MILVSLYTRCKSRASSATSMPLRHESVSCQELSRGQNATTLRDLQCSLPGQWLISAGLPNGDPVKIILTVAASPGCDGHPFEESTQAAPLTKLAGHLPTWGTSTTSPPCPSDPIYQSMSATMCHVIHLSLTCQVDLQRCLSITSTSRPSLRSRLYLRMQTLWAIPMSHHLCSVSFVLVDRLSAFKRRMRGVQGQKCSSSTI